VIRVDPTTLGRPNAFPAFTVLAIKISLVGAFGNIDHLDCQPARIGEQLDQTSLDVSGMEHAAAQDLPSGKCYFSLSHTTITQLGRNS
jgi:hypothetical protein